MTGKQWKNGRHEKREVTGFRIDNIRIGLKFETF